MNNNNKFDIAIVLNYYYPYISGLSETARIVAEGLVENGLSVAVIATKHIKELPVREVIGGVHIFRSELLFKIGRGPISPTFINLVRKIAKQSKILHLHLPMIEAAVITIVVPKIPIVSTYHIDLWLTPSFINQLQISVVNLSAKIAIKNSSHIVVNSDDQAENSLLWPTIREKSWSSIPAPCLDPRGGKDKYRENEGYHIGYLGRIVPDKGIEFLISGFKKMAKDSDRLLLAGEYEGVAGGSNIDKLRQLIGDDNRVKFLGLLSREETKDFYASIDTFALTSVAESFGIVQAEAMMCGIPVVSSNLPGGRTPVQQTCFGILTEPADIKAISEALTKLRNFPENEKGILARKARTLYGFKACISSYLSIFNSLSNFECINPQDIVRKPKSM